MKVEKIRHYAALFGDYLQSSEVELRWELPDVVSNWQQHFSTDPLLLADSYDKSLNSRFSNALWGGSYHSAKSIMKMLIEKDKFFMAESFQDLFNESKDLGLRLNRFKDHCDEVFYTLSPELKKLNTHHHHQKQIPLIYLACQYPDQYCFWDFEKFRKMMVKTGALQIPADVETERYFKSMRAIFGIIKKDTTTPEMWSQVLAKYKISLNPCLIFMNHFADFVAKTP